MVCGGSWGDILKLWTVVGWVRFVMGTGFRAQGFGEGFPESPAGSPRLGETNSHLYVLHDILGSKFLVLWILRNVVRWIHM